MIDHALGNAHLQHLACIAEGADRLGGISRFIVGCEGAVGGLFLCYIYAFLCVTYLPLGDTLFGAWAIRFGWVPMFVMVTVLAAFSVFGDLFESQLKRLAGVKDSSHLLPGHGGVLDRVDALIPTMPIAALLAGLI